MENKNKFIPYLLGIGGIALIYFYLKGKKKPIEKMMETPESKKVSEEKVERKVITGTDLFPIGSGSKGYNVQLLQIALGGKSKLPISFKKGKPDGVFGLETERVLVAQTGKNTVDSSDELDAIATKNGLVRSLSRVGYTYIPKSQQSILAQSKDQTPSVLKR
jgi:hypothetical protein